MSPPATGEVATTAVPRSSSARLATSGWRAIRLGPRPPGRSRLRALLQGGHDRVARALDHCQHLLEPVVPTVVRVGTSPPGSTGSKSRNMPTRVRRVRRRRRGWPRPSRARGRTPRARSRRTAGRGAGSRRSRRRSAWPRRAGPSGCRRASRRCRTRPPRRGRRGRRRRAGSRARRGPWASGRCCRGRRGRSGSEPSARCAGRAGISRGDRIATRTPQPTTVMMIEPTSALQKPSTWKPRSKMSASQAVNSSIAALITSSRKPRVRMMNGSDSSLTTGSMKVDTRPRISATGQHVEHDLSWSSALPLRRALEPDPVQQPGRDRQPRCVREQPHQEPHVVTLAAARWSRRALWRPSRDPVAGWAVS